MRILWIEDFGGKATVDGLIGGLTGWLNDDSIDVLADEIKNILRSYPHDFDGWRRFYQASSSFTSLGHEVDFCMHFLEVERLLDSKKSCDNYDVVLIDIDLSENDFFAVMPDSVDPTRAGFWIYNRLVHAGFPPERLAFFTGNDDKADEFVVACSKLYIHPKPTSFGKIRPVDNKGVTLSNWLTSLEQADDRYIMLRRGVLDGITFAEELLSVHNESAIRFNRYVRRGDVKLSYEQAVDYLYSLRHLTPIRASKGDMNIQLRGLRYLLCCEWERALPDEGSDDVFKALGWIMKYFRNWSSHGHLLDKASVSDLAFLVLAALRTGFLVPENVGHDLRHYEYWLLSAMGKGECSDRDTMSQLLTNSYIRARVSLNNEVGWGSESRLFEKVDGKSKRILLKNESNFQVVVNQLALAKIQPPDIDFLLAIREIFIHAVLFPQPIGVGSAFDNLSDSQVIAMAYQDALHHKVDALPYWVKATWAHLLPSKTQSPVPLL